MSVRDHLTSLGHTDVAGRFQDDASLVDHLVQQYQLAQQQQQLIPYANEYLTHAADFQRWRQEQARTAQQAQQQQKPKFWDPPQIQPGWEQLANQTNCPPQIRMAVESYNQYRRDFAQKFLSDPASTLTPLIQEVAQQVAGGMLQQNLGQFSERNAAQDFVRSHQNWLYDRGPSGNVQLSPQGRQFQEFVQEAEQIGVQGVVNQQRYAMRLMGGVPQQQQAPSPQAQNQQLKQNFLNRPNPAASFNLSGHQPTPPPATPPTSLAENIRRNLAAGGVTDQSLSIDMR